MRLIDADALETHEQLEPMGNGMYEYVQVVYKDDIDDAPTIEPELTGKRSEDGGRGMKWSEFLDEKLPEEITTGQVRTNIECPECGRQIYLDNTIVLTSYPCKYSYWCACGWSSSSPIKWQGNKENL